MGVTVLDIQKIDFSLFQYMAGGIEQFNRENNDDFIHTSTLDLLYESTESCIWLTLFCPLVRLYRPHVRGEKFRPGRLKDQFGSDRGPFDKMLVPTLVVFYEF